MLAATKLCSFRKSSKRTEFLFEVRDVENFAWPLATVNIALKSPRRNGNWPRPISYKSSSSASAVGEYTE